MVAGTMIDTPDTDAPAILLADDDVFNLEYFQHILLESGYRVTTAENGADALALLETHSFDAVIANHEMPLVDGMQLLLQCKERWPGVGRVFQWAVLHGSTLLRLINDVQVHGCFTVPPTPDQLLEITRRAVAAGRAYRDRAELIRRLAG